MSGFLSLLAGVVARQPSAPAIVVAGDLVHSYARLWQRSSALADQLERHGVGRGQVVGLHLHRSPEFIVAMLACWMRRAAFVPLEPTLPKARLALMAEECELACLVADPGPLPWLSTHTPVLAPASLPEPSQAPEALPEIDPESEPAPEDLAYLIYSSGSTGHPKGVEVLHRGLTNVLQAQIKAFALRGDSRLLWLLSPSFDASQSDIGTALLAGAEIHIESPSLVRDPEALLRALDDRQITHLDLPPSLLRLLDARRAPESLHTLVVGGEVCPPETVRRWARQCRVVNVYGPTEATICTSMIECSATWHRPLIGKPIRGVQYRVLDGEQKPVGAGEVGELYIGGSALARGYRRRPELTRQRFVRLEGQTFFRSGDLLRVHEDGALEFVGRSDRQVKHGGVLVAPEEIEAHMASLPGVRECAVRQEWVGRRSVLAAYCAVEESASAADIRTMIGERLPPALLPSRLILRGALPRTLSGKVDFAALADSCLAPTSPMKSPRGEQEKGMARLWQEVLGVQHAGRDSDFFALGGDSMAVVELLALANSRGVALSAEQVYQHPRLADLAAVTGGRSPGVGRRCEDLEPWATLPAPLEARLRRAALREPTPSRDGSAVLLTGATGFLGAHLLGELLGRSEARLVLLVRAPSLSRGWQRLDANLAALGLELSPSERGRCSLVLGDLRERRMGLPQDRWRELSQTVARIYHCAAAVNLLEPLEMLADSNILSCQRILELMCAGRCKELHYASTLSVFVGSDRNQGLLRERDEIASLGRLHGGYAQSKWVAERLLRKSAGRAGAISFYRFGLLIGEAERGGLSQCDWLALYVRGLLEGRGALPEPSGELSVDLTPVGYAASAMAHLSLAGPRLGATFHIANDKAASMAELHAAVLARRPRVQANSPALSAVAQLGACRQSEGYDHLRPCDLFQATRARFDCSNTRAGLADSGIAAPPPAALLMRAYVERLMAESSP